MDKKRNTITLGGTMNQEQKQGQEQKNYHIDPFLFLMLPLIFVSVFMSSIILHTLLFVSVIICSIECYCRAFDIKWAITFNFNSQPSNKRE